MISVRTCNFWDSFCTVVPVLGFVLFFFPVKSEKSPSTSTIDHRFLVLSTQYSSTSTSTFSTFDTCVCVCVCYCTYMKLHIHVYVCTTYHVLRIFLLLAQTCVHTTLLYKTLLLVTVTYYGSASCLPKRWRCTCTQRLPSTVPHTADAPLRLRIAHRLQF